MTDSLFVTVDVHGMDTVQAAVKIDSVIRHAGGAYTVRVIHGFNGGTAIRDMVWQRYSRDSAVIRVRQGDNEGVTELVLRELYTPDEPPAEKKGRDKIKKK